MDVVAPRDASSELDAGRGTEQQVSRERSLGEDWVARLLASRWLLAGPGLELPAPLTLQAETPPPTQHAHSANPNLEQLRQIDFKALFIQNQRVRQRFQDW